jgi:hypothetical protein
VLFALIKTVEGAERTSVREAIRDFEVAPCALRAFNHKGRCELTELPSPGARAVFSSHGRVVAEYSCPTEGDIEWQRTSFAAAEGVAP